MTIRRRIQTALAAAAIAATTLTGCSQYGWIADASPAAGVNVDSDSSSVRNAVVVVNDSGQAVLLGSIALKGGGSVSAIAVSSISADAKHGEVQIVKRDVPVAADALEQLNVGFQDASMKPGLSASVTFAFANGTTQRLDVPTIGATHPDFADVWAANAPKAS